MRCARFACVFRSKIGAGCTNKKNLSRVVIKVVRLSANPRAFLYGNQGWFSKTPLEIKQLISSPFTGPLVRLRRTGAWVAELVLRVGLKNL